MFFVAQPWWATFFRLLFLCLNDCSRDMTSFEISSQRHFVGKYIIAYNAFLTFSHNYFDVPSLQFSDTYLNGCYPVSFEGESIFLFLGFGLLRRNSFTERPEKYLKFWARVRIVFLNSLYLPSSFGEILLFLDLLHQLILGRSLAHASRSSYVSS